MHPSETSASTSRRLLLTSFLLTTDERVVPVENHKLRLAVQSFQPQDKVASVTKAASARNLIAVFIELYSLCHFPCLHLLTLFHKSYPPPFPVVSLLPPGLPPQTTAWTVSSELLGFFIFSLFFRFCAVR